MQPQMRTPTLGGAWAARKTLSDQLDIEARLTESILARTGLAASIDADGAIHRLDHPDSRRGNKRIWYVCHHDFAIWGDWATSEQHSVFADSTPNPETAHRARQEAGRRKRERQAEKERGYAVAARLARQQWHEAESANYRHPYLLAKQAQPHGLRQQGDALLVPLYANGVLVNLQRIYLDGSKRFMPSGQIKGSASLVGSITGAKRIYLCEGWATAATIYEESGHPVVAAMNCGNLLPVARSLRANLPAEIEIVVAADNDCRTAGNPGLTAGRQVAETIGANLTWPRFPCANCDCSDFNDLTVCERKEVSP